MSENIAPAPKPGRGPRVALLTLLVVVGVVIVVALAVALLRGSPASLDASTPTGVVQRYTQALVDGDVTTARSLVADDEDCGYYTRDGGAQRVTLTGSTVDGDRADVQVVVTTSYDSGPFGSGEYQSNETFVLERSGGDWLIQSAPWPFVECMGSQP